MAKFMYLGEADRPGLVAKHGPTLKIRVGCKDGSKVEFEPADKAKGFDAGHELIETNDSRAVRHLRVDPRFREV